MPVRARIYSLACIFLGAACITASLYPWQPGNAARFCFYLVVCSLASGMKVNLPGVHGTMSVCFLFSLIGIAELSLGEAVIVGCAGVLVQWLWKAPERPAAEQTAFHVAVTGAAIYAAYGFYHWPALYPIETTGPFLMV